MSLRELCPVLQFGDLGDERGKLESASSLAPAKLLWYTYTDCRIDYIMTNKRNLVAKKLF